MWHKRRDSKEALVAIVIYTVPAGVVYAIPTGIVYMPVALMTYVMMNAIA